MKSAEEPPLFRSGLSLFWYVKFRVDWTPDSHLVHRSQELPAITKEASVSDCVRYADKRAALEQVLRTTPFRRGRQVRRFLRYICEMGFRRTGGRPARSLVGVEALGRPAAYSTDGDSTVRRRAYALRQKLDEVYSKELAGAAVRIEVPKGAYVPRFTLLQIAFKGNGAGFVRKLDNQVDVPRTREGGVATAALVVVCKSGSKVRRQTGVVPRRTAGIPKY